MPVVIENEPDENIAGYVTYSYPVVPKDQDFEIFRKTDDDWKRIMKWYNKESESDENKVDKLVKKERFVLNQWPRDPNGLTLKITPRGMDTGNGCELWGATLYDFYRILRLPSLPHWSTISTGSKIAAWMKAAGEKYAKDQLKQARLEDKPRLLPVYDIGEFIELVEEQVWKSNTGKSLKVNRKNTKETYQHLYPPSQYSAPWPLVPFSTPTPRLQKRIRFGYLPRKLVVHDPWNVLCTGGPKSKSPESKSYKWGSTKDIIRIYNLNLSARAESESYQKGHEPCPVAHLYITPKRRIGTGNHSYVFQAELELPRHLLVGPKACYECAIKSMEEEGPGEDDDVVGKMTDAERLYYFEKTFKNGRPFEASDLKDKRFPPLKHIKWQQGPPYCEHLERGIRVPPSQRASVTAKLTLPDERHPDGRMKERHSEHLRNEAASYMKFPDHFFEHWNGYNVIHPLSDPTPVGAVVPQFYGYYTPDESNKPVGKGTFMSPILLLEHCGTQVDPGSLSIDHKQECFALLRRLHIAGYVHNSYFQRNVVMQKGPLTVSPFNRSEEHLRFRLIDFGRIERLEEKNWRFDSKLAKLTKELDVAYSSLGIELYM